MGSEKSMMLKKPRALAARTFFELLIHWLAYLEGVDGVLVEDLVVVVLLLEVEQGVFVH